MVVVRYLTWVLGTKLGSSSRTVCLLNHEAISSPLNLLNELFFSSSKMDI